MFRKQFIGEVNRQLNGIKVSNVIASLNTRYELTERTDVTQLFSQSVVAPNRALLHVELIAPVDLWP